MILKILEKGSTKVYAPDDQVADYLFLGFTDTGTTTEVVVTDPSKEIVEMKIEDDVVTAFRYKGDPVWRTVAGSGGGVTVYADLATLKAVSTASIPNGTQVYVENMGLYTIEKNSKIPSDNFDILRPDDNLARYKLVKKATKNLNFYTASNNTNATESNASGFLYDKASDELMVQASVYPDDNIITSDSFIGKNKKLYLEVEAGINSMGFHIYLGANGHAADGVGYSAYDAYMDDASAGNLMLNKNTGITPTTAWQAQDITGASYSTALGATAYKAIKVDDIINVDIYSLRNKSRVRSLYLKNSNINTIPGTINGVSMKYSSKTQARVLSSFIAEDVNITNKIKNIVCLGDSLTSKSNLFMDAGYVWTEKMAYSLRKQNSIVVNAGVGGNTIAQMTARLATDVTSKYNSGMNNVLVLFAGMNDFAQGADAATVYGRLTTLAGTLKAGGWSVAVVNLTNVFAPYVADPALVNSYITTFNALIASSSDIFDYKIDLSTALKDSVSGLTDLKYIKKTDGVHLVSSAQQIIACETLKALNLD